VIKRIIKQLIKPITRLLRRLLNSDANTNDTAIVAINQILERLKQIEQRTYDYDMQILNNIKLFWKKIQPHDVIGTNKIRIGNNKDGGYIILQDLNSIDGVISIGVGSDNSSDVYLARQKIKVYAFDHTINRLPRNHKNIVFFPIGVGNCKPTKPLSELIHQVAGLKSNQLMLMMDVEGAEYEAILDCPTEILSQFKQIVIEFHGLSMVLNSSRTNDFFSVMDKMSFTHHVVHVHANNISPCLTIGAFQMPFVMEITFARSTDYCFKPYHGTLPTTIDKPNCSVREDYKFDVYSG